MMGYQPRGKPIDPSKLILPTSGTGVVPPSQPKRMCYDCFKKGRPACRFKEIHPLALACEEFTRFSIEGVDVNSQRIRFPQPPPARVMK